MLPWSRPLFTPASVHARLCSRSQTTCQCRVVPALRVGRQGSDYIELALQLQFNERSRSQE